MLTLLLVPIIAIVSVIAVSKIGGKHAIKNIRRMHGKDQED